MNNSRNINYFSQFDSLRFIAAFAVLIMHVTDKGSGYFGWPYALQTDTGGDTLLLRHIKIFCSNLAYGVDMFFILSGFLITYLLLSEQKNAGTISLKQFYMRRILRIWPLYYLILAFNPLFVNLFGETPPNYKMHLLFLGNFSLINEHWVNSVVSHLWSICIEEHFYLFWPLIVKYTNPKNLVPFTVFLIVVSWLSKFQISSWHEEVRWHALYLHTLARIDTILIGAITAMVYFKLRFIININKIYIALVFVFITFLLSIDYISAWDNTFDAIFKRFFYSILLLCLFLITCFRENYKSSKLNKFIGVMGKASYSLYMWHPLILMCVIQWMISMSNERLLVCFILTALLSMLVSYTSYRFFEMPFLRLKDKFYSSYKNEIQ